MTGQKTSHNFTKIAFKPLYTNLFNIVLLSIFLSLGSSKLYSQDISKKKTAISSNKQADSPKKTINQNVQQSGIILSRRRIEIRHNRHGL